MKKTTTILQYPLHFWNSIIQDSVVNGQKMQVDYISSDEEDVYMRSKPTEEEVTDIRDLRSDLERFQQAATFWNLLVCRKTL